MSIITLTVNKKLHLVPPNCIDLGENILNPTINPETKENYVARLEAIKEYCDSILEQHKRTRLSTPIKRKRK